jgi:endo-alpha-1,4-polygalactosaminidase (GH114 family)
MSLSLINSEIFPQERSQQSAFEIFPIDQEQVQQKVRGYFVRSTARIHVEESVFSVDCANKNSENTRKRLDEIADHLITGKDSQLVVFVHGYANKRSDAEARSKKIFEYAKTKSELQDKNIAVISLVWHSNSSV